MQCIWKCRIIKNEHVCFKEVQIVLRSNGSSTIFQSSVPERANLCNKRQNEIGCCAMLAGQVFHRETSGTPPWRTLGRYWANIFFIDLSCRNAVCQKKPRCVLTKEIMLLFESVVGTLIYGSCCYFEASNPPIHTWWKHFRNQKIMAHLKSLLYREISWEGYPMKYFGIIFCTPLFIENSV